MDVVFEKVCAQDYGFNELVNLYGQETKQPIDGRWKAETVARKLNEHRQQVAERRAREQAAQERRDQRERDRQERAEQRQSLGNVAENWRLRDGEEAFALHRVARFAVEALKDHEEQTMKFAENFAKNPHQTMTWATELFEVAGKHHVASWVKVMVEEGFSIEDMTKEAKRELMHYSRYVSRSTSPSSNLTEDYTRAAWAKVVGYLEGTEF